MFEVKRSAHHAVTTACLVACRLMLELKKAQVEQYVQKVTGMAQAAGCKVTAVGRAGTMLLGRSYLHACGRMMYLRCFCECFTNP